MLHVSLYILLVEAAGNLDFADEGAVIALVAEADHLLILVSRALVSVAGLAPSDDQAVAATGERSAGGKGVSAGTVSEWRGGASEGSSLDQVHFDMILLHSGQLNPAHDRTVINALVPG